jgi:putative hydrolase of the HAD superfamily
MQTQNQGRAKIRGVIFDYGNVLSLDQPFSAVEEMAEICDVPVKVFQQGYWEYRLAYDRGDLDVNQYWNNRLRSLGISLSPTQIAKIVLVDSESWSHLNPASVEWVRQLHGAGIKLALLSNMPLELKNYMVANLGLFSYFQHLVFSCDVHLVKPEPGIYQSCLNLLQLAPHEVLFLDDKPQNVEAAAALGIHSLVFDSIENTLASVREKFDLPVPASLPAASVAEL